MTFSRFISKKKPYPLLGGKKAILMFQFLRQKNIGFVNIIFHLPMNFVLNRAIVEFCRLALSSSLSQPSV